VVAAKLLIDPICPVLPRPFNALCEHNLLLSVGIWFASVQSLPFHAELLHSFRRSEDRKAASIDQKEAELIDRLDARVQSLEERDEKRETEHRQALAKLDRVLTACTLMVKDYELHTPGSPILAQARALLVRDYPHLFNTRVKRPT